MSGRFEELDDTPVAMPLRFQRVENLTDQIRRTIREEFSRQAQIEGHESFLEADDFDVGDDYDPRSDYELDDDQVRYDIRNDPRYVRKAEVAHEGGKSEKGVVREGGEGADKGKKRAIFAKRKVSKPDVGSEENLEDDPKL